VDLAYFAYQLPSPEVLKNVDDGLQTHYDAWRLNSQGKERHCVLTVVAGPGTGTSRLLG